MPLPGAPGERGAAHARPERAVQPGTGDRAQRSRPASSRIPLTSRPRCLPAPQACPTGAKQGALAGEGLVAAALELPAHRSAMSRGRRSGGGLLAHALRVGYPQGDARIVLAMVAEPERVSGERFGGGGCCRSEAGDGGSLDSASRVELGAVSGVAGLARSRPLFRPRSGGGGFGGWVARWREERGAEEAAVRLFTSGVAEVEKGAGCWPRPSGLDRPGWWTYTPGTVTLFTE